MLINKTIGYISVFENLLLTLLVIITCVPEISNKFIFIVIILLWIITIIIKNKKNFIIFFVKPNIFMYSIYIWIATYIMFIIFRYDTTIIQKIQTYIRMVFTIAVFVYYLKEKNKKILKNIIITSAVCIIPICIKTIYALTFDSNIARLLATGKDFEFEINTFGIGSYAFIYGLVFVIIGITGIFIKKQKYKIIDRNSIILLLIYILFTCTIYKAKFMISYILILLGTLMIIFNINNYKKVLIISIIVLSIVIILSIPIATILENIAKETKDINISTRLNDMSIFLKTGNIDTTVDIKERVQVYEKSINSFINNPLFGIGVNQENNEKYSIGQHSLILDELAKYGIIGSLPIIIMLISISYTIYNELKDSYKKDIFFTCIVIFGIFITINTALFVLLFYLMFVLTPSILYLYEEKGDKDENTLDS